VLSLELLLLRVVLIIVSHVRQVSLLLGRVVILLMGVDAVDWSLVHGVVVHW